MSKFRTEHEELIYNEGFDDGYKCRQRDNARLTGYFHVQARQTGKTHTLINNFMAAPGPKVMIVSANQMKGNIIQILPPAFHDNVIVLPTSESVKNFCIGKLKRYAIYIDEYTLFSYEVQAALAEYLPLIATNIQVKTSDPENLYADLQMIKLIRENKYKYDHWYNFDKSNPVLTYYIDKFNSLNDSLISNPNLYLVINNSAFPFSMTSVHQVKKCNILV